MTSDNFSRKAFRERSRQALKSSVPSLAHHGAVARMPHHCALNKPGAEPDTIDESQIPCDRLLLVGACGRRHRWKSEQETREGNTDMAMDERGAMRPIPQVDVRETQRRVKDGGQNGEQLDAVLIDVREQWEYLQERAPGATLIPLSQFVQRYGEIPRDREVLLICHSGQRSFRAAMFLRRQGYEQVGNVSGGMEAWAMAGLPVERGKA